MLPAVKVGENRYPRYLLECIDWALEIYPKDRPQNAKELQEGLLGKGRPFKGERPKIRIPVNDRQPIKDRSWGKIFFVTLLLLLIAAGTGAYLGWSEIKQKYPGPSAQIEAQLKKLDPLYRQLLELVRSR
jgi:hypothetical protein